MQNLLLAGLIATAGCATLPPTNRHIELRNPTVRIVIAPDLGRITTIEVAGSGNLLRTLSTNEWHDTGGEYIWPVVQTHWRTAFGKIWPPPAVMDARPWNAREWITADGTHVCRLEQTLEAPLHLRATRQFELPSRGGELRIVQTLERIAPSTTPVTLWNICQVQQPDQIFLPAGEVVTLSGPPVAAAQVIDFAKSDDVAHKLGVRARPAWIAARKGNVLITERVSPTDGMPPDSGCSVELWWSRTAGYAELELLSAEHTLAVGERLANTLTMEFKISHETTK